MAALKPQICVEIDPIIKTAMDKLRVDEGIPLATQVRKGVLLFLESKRQDTPKRKPSR